MTDGFLRLLIAPDSFKGSLTAHQVCLHLRSGMEKVNVPLQIVSVPLADGGEGTVDAILHALDGEWIETEVRDPLNRPVKARYGIVPEQGLAIIEMAAASGLELLKENERNPLVASTFGTGELILHGLEHGCRKFIIGIGGSATNDGGIGMLKALGAEFQYVGSSEKRADHFTELVSIDLKTLDPRLKDVEFEIACDVTNPLTGVNGATHVFGRQKGATSEMIQNLEKGMIEYGGLLEAAAGRSIVEVPGAGAAGGLGAGLLALPSVKLRSGFEIVSDVIQLDSEIKQADLVITGEGKVDAQTLFGKVPFGVAGLAAKYKVPVVCVAGTVGSDADVLLNHGIHAVFSILQKPVSLEEAKRNAPVLLENLGEQLIRLIQVGRSL